LLRRQTHAPALHQRKPSRLKFCQRRNCSVSRTQEADKSQIAADFRIDRMQITRRAAQVRIKKRRPGFEPGTKDHEIRFKVASVRKDDTTTFKPGDSRCALAASCGYRSNEFVGFRSELFGECAAGLLKQLHTQLPRLEICSHLGRPERADTRDEFPQQLE